MIATTRLETFTLLDDGTLDTVIMCDACKEEIRIAEVDRASNGAITKQGWLTMEELFWEHECT